MTIRPTIVFTGGGTAGHVTPNIALIERFQQARWNIFYIGSKTGIEYQLIPKLGIKYYAISTGKLRRYFSWQNFLDVFRIVIGICQAFFLLHHLRPRVIFSKGGFVAVPVVVGAWLNRIPAISHESDVTLGLANKLLYPFVKKFCVTFKASRIYFKNPSKCLVTGAPLRKNLYGDADRGYKICGFSRDKKTILIFGGSLGAEKINKIARELLLKLLANFQVAHICGVGKIDTKYNHVGYKQFEYVNEEFGDLLACADLVISRAGANTVFELLALHKPNILIPLGLETSRGDQIANAEYAVANGFSQMIPDAWLTVEVLRQKINWVMVHYDSVMINLLNFHAKDSVQIIYRLLLRYAGFKS